MTIPLFSCHFLLLIYCVSLGVHILVVSGECSSNQQQSLLLQLKNSLNFEPALSTKLVKWNNGSYYCSWEGVSCKNGCVTYLDLSFESISGELDGSSALFSLQYIKHLNLAFNDFNYGIPSEFNKLASLSYLNLSNAGFAGQIPIEISHLWRLVILDLSTMYFAEVPALLQLQNPNLNLLIGNLSEIVELHLDGVKISAQGAQWCRAISSSLPKLRVLSLSGCDLLGPIDSSLLKLNSLSIIRLDSNDLSTVPEFLSNFTNLTSLGLMNSGLHGTFPNKIFQIPTLQVIDLIGNQELQGSLPDFPKNEAMSLQSLLLCRTNFSGSLPESIGNLKMLSKVDISYCSFTGPIPRSVATLKELVNVDMSFNKFNGSVPLLSMAKNLTDINLSYNEITGQINSTHWENLTSLVNLNLADNKLSGSIPSSLFSLPLLQKLQLSNNQFSGQLPEFANISRLDTLDLSSNNLGGTIPKSIFDLHGLKFLSLSSNNFSGSFPLNNVQQLKNLSTLDLSYNSLSISYYSTNSSQSSFPIITTLKLASGKLRKFPDFLRNQSKLTYLDLSQNQIDGEIPNWIWNLSNLSQLNLSCNSLETLEGPFINLTSTLSMLDLHSNQLQGHIPILPPYATYLDYSRNNFSSTIPTDIGNYLTYTTFFSLSSNNLHGIISGSICSAVNLEVLDFSSNSLSGKIPECLSAIVSHGFAVLNLRRNNLIGRISDNFPGNCGLQMLDLNGNQLEGKFPKSLAQCAELVILNLGNNRMKDSFPYLLGNMSFLRVLVLRSNNYFGRFDCHKTTGSWPMLQIIDLANNSFSGNIPGNCLTTWRAMMVDEDASSSVLNHPEFKVLMFSELYYQDALTITSKGLEMELAQILNIYTLVDLSGNNFSGSIPKEMGGLTSLYVLNLSSNSLTGEIPSSLANLKQLESLDLSKNKLSGQIPEELAELSFLSSMNLSYNQLVGLIPTSTQFSTLPAYSFEGNKGLWGPPLTEDNRTGMPPPTNNGSPSHFGQDQIDWDFLGVEIGFVSGFGIAIGSLLFCKKWRRWYYRAMYSILVKIFPQLEQRLGNHRRHIYINPRWRLLWRS